MTNRHIGYVTLLVRDYDEAKAWFCDLLGFNLIEDTLLADGKHWVLLAPKHEAGFFCSSIPMTSRKTSVQSGEREFT